MALATFAGGCFWHVEEAFRTLPGVLKTTVGYLGGHTPNPTYEDVCSDQTGHAEAVQIEFDPAVIRYEDLLLRFWQIHNPLTPNRQGVDVGTQYRAAIFYHDDEQQRLAEESKQHLQAELTRSIATEIHPATTFYRAEDYHQQYLAKRGRTSCAIK